MKSEDEMYQKPDDDYVSNADVEPLDAVQFVDDKEKYADMIQKALSQGAELDGRAVVCLEGVYGLPPYFIKQCAMAILLEKANSLEDGEKVPIGLLQIGLAKNLEICDPLAMLQKCDTKEMDDGRTR